MRVLSERDVRELLDMESCVEAMEEVLTALARRELHQPLRSIVRPPGAENLFGLMPTYRGGPAPAFALKEIVVVPSNPARGLDTHMGGVLLHDGDTGELLALLNAAPVTEIRTAAVLANVPCITTVQGLGAAVQGIEAMRAGEITVRSLQDWARAGA